MRRFQIQYGQFPGEKGYVVVDDETGNTLNRGRTVLFTSHNRSDSVAKAQELNDEAERSITT